MICALAVISCGGKENPEEKQETANPAAPTGLTLRGATETSLTFQWDAMDNATGYSWNITHDGTQVQADTRSGKNSRNVTVSGLTKATAYKFSVASTAGTFTSAYSSVDASTEGSQTPVDPDPPTPSGISYEDFRIPAAEEDGSARAFPGAEGGGMYVTGGRGGAVYHVTNLFDDTREGSLRYGIEKMGRPLTIVFDVAGVIPLTKQLKVSKGDLTIAGQTAPGAGICLKNYTLSINAGNVIVRFIRCRMGDEQKSEDDAMHINSSKSEVAGVIIDHCSLSWCTDECGSFYGVTNFTLQWCILSESLRNSIHGKGSHGYGGLWGGENATYHHNLLAHHDSRNARIDHDYLNTLKGPVSLVNNVIYNWQGNTTYGGESFNASDDYRKYNIINNYYRPGPATKGRIRFIDPTTSCDNCSGLKTYPDGSSVPSGSKIVPGHFYMDGNVMHGKSEMTADNWQGLSSGGLKIVSTIKSTEIFRYSQMSPSVSLHSAQKAFDAVLAHAGASLCRDGIDARIAGEANEGKYTYTGSNGSTGGFIDTQTDVADATWKNGWPVYSATAEQLEAAADADGDGIPDAVEDKWGLDKGNASDGAACTIDPQKRYTNLEMYLHYLVRDIVAAQNTDANCIKL